MHCPSWPFVHGFSGNTTVVLRSSPSRCFAFLGHTTVVPRPPPTPFLLGFFGYTTVVPCSSWPFVLSFLGYTAVAPPPSRPVFSRSPQRCVGRMRAATASHEIRRGPATGPQSIHQFGNFALFWDVLKEANRVEFSSAIAPSFPHLRSRGPMRGPCEPMQPRYPPSRSHCTG